MTKPKKVFSLVLALAMCLGMLPGRAAAAQTNLPDWYFLFAIFKNVDADYHQNGETKHTAYTMTQDEIDFVKEDARNFEAFMNQVGVMRAHVDIVEIDETITELEDYGSGGGYLAVQQSTPLLERSNVNLDQYDHVTCAASLNVDTDYLGLGGTYYENGTGHSFINLKNREFCLNTLRAAESKFPPSMYVHEFLHFMGGMSVKFGKPFDLHQGGEYYNTRDVDNWRGYYTDVIQNHIHALPEHGTGVHPGVWQHPPHILRTMAAYMVPSDITSIAAWAFQGCTALTQVTIPISVTSIGEAAFYEIGITDVYYEGTEEQWRAIQIGDFNSTLTEANIHYNSVIVTQPVTPVQPQQPVGNATAFPTNDKLEVNGSEANPTVYKINGSNYFKIRDVAALLNGTEKQFAVGYDDTMNAVTATTGQGYAMQSGDLAGTAKDGAQSAAASNDAIYVNGQKITAEVYKIGGSNYFKLRDLGKALDFYVGWSADRGIYIETGNPYNE